MAVRDRNLFAWQAYVITMTFVSVGLLLGMFFLWRSHSDLSTKLEAANDNLTSTRQQFVTSEDRVKRLRLMLGYGEASVEEMDQLAEKFATDEQLASVEKDYAEAMKLFAPSVPANEKNLLKLPSYLLDTVRARNNDISAARERETKLAQEMTATAQRETKKAADAVAAQKKAEADLAASRDTHSKQVQELNKQKAEALASFDQYKSKYDQQLAELQGNLRQQTQLVQTQAAAIAKLTDDINQFNEPDFASPQGQIIRTARGATELWINLGLDDGLREGVPFSIIDEGDVNVSEAKPKATIIITKVFGPHLSQAKVQDYDVRTPIVTGDKVYSPAWRPGRKVGFALVGRMDVNEDGKDDIDQVIERIRLAGGQVDAHLDSKGQVSGPGLDYNTSWLVLGTDLTVPEGASEERRAEQQAKTAVYAEFIKQARQNGVQQISLDKLLGYLKTTSSDRTVPLGNRLRADDFSIERETRPPSSRGSVSDLYTPRFSPK